MIPLIFFELQRMCKGSTSERKNEVMIRSVGTLEWPDSFDNINVKDENNLHPSICSIFCVGQGFINFEKSLNVKETDQSNNSNGEDEEGIDVGEGKESEQDSPSTKKDEKKKGKKEINLMDLSEEELEELSYYDILGGLPLHSTADDVRKAFHRASLKYHPDKITDEGTTENESSSNTKDPVFLKVKQAFETLGNAAKRKAYDSTLDFDESIPPKDVPAEDFYRIYGPVFERNLRFSKELDPSSGNDTNNNKKKNKKKNKKNSPTTHLLGSDDEPIEKVHAFYDYWIHFESWRDFTLQATEQTKHDTDMAECRYEKRWMEKEIARLAKQYKKDEMARIHTMVERAMASDPRLQRERERLAREKKELAEKRQREKAENERRQREQKEAEEKRQQQLEEEEKQKREMERQKNQIAKKQLRKLKQSLRKVTTAAYPVQSSSSQIWDSANHMNQDVELLCSSLSIKEMNDLLKAMGAISLVSSNGTANKGEPDFESVAKKVSLDTISCKAKQVRNGNEQAKAEERNAIRSNEQARLKKVNQKKKQKNPWSKEEVSALAKAVRKYPAGNSNRWETIATFVNNLCSGSARSKEECIEKFNNMTTNVTISKSSEKNESQNDDSDKKDTDATEWTEEQDKQLQAGLATFKASMDKNERWTAIAKCVDGKTKKECVQRFKAIREALKKK